MHNEQCKNTKMLQHKKKIYKNLADSAVHQFTGDKWHMDYEK